MIPQGDTVPASCLGSPRDFSSVQNPTAALQPTPSLPHTVIKHLGTLRGQHEPFIWDFFYWKGFPSLKSTIKDYEENSETWSRVIASDSPHVKEMINICPIISYKFYLPLLCFAKERQMVSQPTTKTWKRKKNPFKTNKCKLTYFLQTRVFKSSGF